MKDMEPRMFMLGLGPLWAIIVSYPFLILLIQATNSGSTGIVLGPLVTLLCIHLVFVLVVARTRPWPQVIYPLGLVSFSTSLSWALTTMLVLVVLAEGSPFAFVGTPQAQLLDDTLVLTFTWLPTIFEAIYGNRLPAILGREWLVFIFPIVALTLILTTISSLGVWAITRLRRGAHQPPTPNPQPL